MAISDYIVCCKCGVKLIYDGNREQRDWWEQRWNKEPEIECPDCKAKQLKPLTDEEIKKIWGSYFSRGIEFARAIEASLGITGETK